MTASLLELSSYLRQRLVRALETGQLCAPYSEMAVRNALGGAGESRSVCDELQRLHDREINGTAVAYAITLAARAESSVSRPDLVWSGPEVRGLHARDTRRVFEELVGGAQTSLWISSYTYYDGPKAFELLARRMDQVPDLQTTLLLNIKREWGNASPADELVRRFTDALWNRGWPGKRQPEVFYDPRSLLVDKRDRVVSHDSLGVKHRLEISDELGLARATVTYHLRRMGAEDPGYYIGRRAIVATLGGSGVRASELCDIRIRDLRLHAASGAHFRIPDAKTEAGIREVQVSPDLLEEIVAHIDRLRRAGQPTDTDAHLFPNRKGRRMTRQRVGEIVREASTLASTHLVARGLPALPNTGPHTLRRTYISIALLANRFDVLWVMRQVGHADSHMTMDVYAQLQQRVERQHGEAFDDLVRQARERLYGTVEAPEVDEPEPEDAELSEEPCLEDFVEEWREDRDES